MSISRACCVIGYLGISLITFVPGLWAISAQAQTFPPTEVQAEETPEKPEANCNANAVAGKCGTDVDLEPISCGGQTCFGTRIVYGQLISCTGGQDGGLKSCCSGKFCNRVTFSQECREGRCRLVSREIEPVLPISFACGSACGDNVGVEE